jgi:hypothetical protein
MKTQIIIDDCTIPTSARAPLVHRVEKDPVISKPIAVSIIIIIIIIINKK